MSTTPTAYKPSPLSFNSPRASPFRRPDSATGRSPSTIRAGTPPIANISPLKPSTPTASPSPEKPHTTPLRSTANPPGTSPWLSTRKTAINPAEAPPSPTRNTGRSHSGSSDDTLGTDVSTRPLAAPTTAPASTRPLPTPTRDISSSTATTARPTLPRTRSHADPLTHLPPALLRSMRESFSVLDRGNSGSVSSADLAETLAQVGLDSSTASVSGYLSHFGGGRAVNMSTYLNGLAAPMEGMTRPDELTAAFAAFDADDGGEVDLVELRDALLRTAPEPGERRLGEAEVEGVLREFGGRKAFGKGSGGGLHRGEVFRYLEFVAAVNGGSTKEGEGEGLA